MIESQLNESKVILLVDDEPAIRLLVREILAGQGYQIFEASSVVEAFDVLGSKSVNLVISDVVMPVNDGFQLAVGMKERFPAVKILLVSGYNDYLGNAMSVEMLKKPFKTAELLSSVQRLLDESWEAAL